MRRHARLIASAALVVVTACGGGAGPAAPVSAGPAGAGSGPAGAGSGPAGAPGADLVASWSAAAAAADPCANAGRRLDTRAVAAVPVLATDDASVGTLGTAAAAAIAEAIHAGTFCSLPVPPDATAAIDDAWNLAAAEGPAAGRERLARYVATLRGTGRNPVARLAGAVGPATGPLIEIPGAPADAAAATARGATAAGAADAALGGDGADAQAAAQDAVRERAGHLDQADAQTAASIASDAQAVDLPDVEQRAIDRVVSEVEADLAAIEADPCSASPEQLRQLSRAMGAVQAVGGGDARVAAAIPALLALSQAMADRASQAGSTACERWRIAVRYKERWPGPLKKAGDFGASWEGHFDISAKGEIHGEGTGLWSETTSCLTPGKGYIGQETQKGTLDFTVLGRRTSSQILLAWPTTIDPPARDCPGEAVQGLDREAILPLLRDMATELTDGDGLLPFDASSPGHYRRTVEKIMRIEVWIWKQGTGDPRG